MTNKNYQTAKMKAQLLARRSNGEKYVIWSLKLEQIEFIEQTMGMFVEPYIVLIETKAIPEVSKSGKKILKDISSAAQRGKKNITRECHNEAIFKLLEEYGIKYKIIKYKIHLIN